MAVTTLPLPRHLTVVKRRSRNRRSANQNATTMTGSDEVKAWLATCTKSHWFFSQKRQDRRVSTSAYANDLNALYELHISFFDAKEASLFKLTWL